MRYRELEKEKLIEGSVKRSEKQLRDKLEQEFVLADRYRN